MTAYIFPSCRCVEGPRPGSGDWRLYPATCLGEQVQGEHLPFAIAVFKGIPQALALLTLVALWPTSVRFVTFINLIVVPLSGLSFGGCFILPNLFFSIWARWVYGLAVKGSLLAKGKWAHSWALMVGLSVLCIPELQMCIFGGHKNFPKCKFVFPKWRLWACWPELDWSCIAFCLSLRVFSCVLFQFDPCSCILAMLLFGCLSCHSCTRSMRL